MTTLAATIRIVTFQDILDAMAQNPDLEAQMRHHLQDEDFRNLPQTVARLAQTVEELTRTVQGMAEREARRDADIAELKAGQAELKEGQARHDADVAELKAGQARHDADVAELKAGQARHDADIAELKEGQDRLEAGQAELKEGQARHDADIAELKEGQARLEAGQAELKEGQSRHDYDIAELREGQARLETGLARVQGGLDRLAGTDYERNIARRLRRGADRYFGIHRAQLIHSVILPNNNALPDLLDDAFSRGLISREEADSAEVVDMVITGEDQAGAPLYAVIEASVSVHQDDVDRALSRSRIIAQAAAASVTPAVVGVNISDPVRSYAAGLQVVAIVMPD